MINWTSPEWFEEIAKVGAGIPEVRNSAVAFKTYYGGGLTKAQIHDFFVAIRQLPNIQRARDEWDNTKLVNWPVDKFGTPMVFETALAHKIWEVSKE